MSPATWAGTTVVPSVMAELETGEAFGGLPSARSPLAGLGEGDEEEGWMAGNRPPALPAPMTEPG